MNIKEYNRKVINLFKNGKATKEQWEEMANAVLYISENDGEEVQEIDRIILGKPTVCDHCGFSVYPGTSYLGCECEQ